MSVEALISKPGVLVMGYFFQEFLKMAFLIYYKMTLFKKTFTCSAT